MQPARQFVLLILVAVFAAGGSAVASEIYKWTDANGNVIYGDRPEDEVLPSVERIALASRRTDPAAVAASVEARQERDQARGEARSAREEAEQAAAEERAAAERQAEQCAEYRARLETYVTSRRLYRMNEAGEREYLDDAGMQEARAALQQRIQDQCSG